MRPLASAVLSIAVSVLATMLVRRLLAVTGGSDESGNRGAPNSANVVVVVMPIFVGNSPTMKILGKRHGGPPFLRHRGRPLK
jgi:membrane protein implicated in regulation of membrane protease activity